MATGLKGDTQSIVAMVTINMIIPLAPDVSMQSYSYYIVFSLWIISAIISSCYTFAWDIRMDWGLFEKGHIIREELIYPHKVSTFTHIHTNIYTHGQMYAHMITHTYMYMQSCRYTMF